MLIRPYMREDLPEVKALHAAQGFDYALPDLDAPSMLVRCVIEENNRVTHAAFLRKTSEAYWIFNPGESRRERLGKMLALSKEMVTPAARAGLEDVHAFLPPVILDLKLHRTLLRLGWQKPLWTCYSRKV
jgi:hypothetical protein